ncbi:GNAT family N-acetyltransferase [Bisgaard Taxon 10/6]|uniref:GNAT family N-acetyltransferase n=1 Tax=Exercitatus varius TaxID=67857 RepID=UPI00294B507F|nr:GNAT family N-acetyltransferase [Exercitatus varius]MDG2916228.1 GNAT family N-acetyltransferase [Exercitatus varius]MDG2952065.1 GNAT family N-acetyltransferase [Exercitatus varius]MDG2957402.1 GNAT family N-acetyltransferase [Exercitatus varius]
MSKYYFELCKNSEREKIYRFWYEIYFKEMGRNADYANHDKRIIYDELENSSEIIIVKNKDNEIIGTSRINLRMPPNSNLGYYDKLYDLKSFNDDRVGIITRYMIRKEYRKTSVGFNLAVATFYFFIKNHIKWGVMDCSPILYKYFEKIGFESHLGVVKHPEYGEVKIMKFNTMTKKTVPLNDPLNFSRIKKYILF